MPKQRYAGDLFNHKIWGTVLFGDLNGDGCSDMWIQFHYPASVYVRDKFHVIYGDPEFILEDRFIYEQDSTGYIGEGFSHASRIISDHNSDGKDDWLHPNNGQYPYYYGYMVNSGGHPPTQFPAAYKGLNTQFEGPLLGLKIDVGDVNGDGLQDLMVDVGYDSQWLWLGGGTRLITLQPRSFMEPRGGDI